jgi:peptidylprolyl isomerase domain and WD repeat-containing protein 1
MYEKSFMHRDMVSHILVSEETEFLMTISVDGFVKFWKKTFSGIEFVKNYRAHPGKISGCSLSYNG